MSGLARTRLKAGSPNRTETVSIGGIQRRRWRPGQRTTMTRLTDVPGYLTDAVPDVHSCSFADTFDQRSTGARALRQNQFIAYQENIKKPARTLACLHFAIVKHLVSNYFVCVEFAVVLLEIEVYLRLCKL